MRMRMRMMAREKGNSSGHDKQRKMINLCSFSYVQTPRALCFHFEHFSGWRGEFEAVMSGNEQVLIKPAKLSAMPRLGG
jgi:hypothetical protein